MIIVVDNFSKLIGLYPAKEYNHALLSWVSIFDVPKETRSDGGSQFTSKMAAIIFYYYLLLVQRIINYMVDGSIGMQPERVIFGE